MTAVPFLPICTIIAGPNGSGKSSLVKDLAPPGEFVNADDVARRLNPTHPENASAAAGREVLLRLSALIGQRQNFSYETTLSSNQALALMRAAKNAGYTLELVFVLLKSADLNVARVKTRVAQGGHDIPTQTILRRYHKSLAKLPEALRLADRAIIYDNTARGLVAVVRLEGGQIAFHAFERSDSLHDRIAGLVGEALNVPKGDVFRT